MIQQDWLMRQVEMLGRMLSRIFFDKETAVYDFATFEDTNAYNLHEHLNELVSKGNLNQAENILFDAIKSTFDLSLLEVAIDFYTKINKLDDKQLEESDFSREEIQQGLEDVSAIYGFNIKDSKLKD